MLLYDRCEGTSIAIGYTDHWPLVITGDTASSPETGTRGHCTLS